MLKPPELALNTRSSSPSPTLTPTDDKRHRVFGSPPGREQSTSDVKRQMYFAPGLDQQRRANVGQRCPHHLLEAPRVRGRPRHGRCAGRRPQGGILCHVCALRHALPQPPLRSVFAPHVDHWCKPASGQIRPPDTCSVVLHNRAPRGRPGPASTLRALRRQYAREDIVSAINRNRVLVICGETGSGKTKQAAQFIFEDYNRGGQGSRCNIVVTQPRRIAAISMAKRAALERHNELSHTAGFQVRLTKQLLTSRGGILFCTVGILVRHWQQNGELVDEVHERDVSTDFLLVRCSPPTAH
ncbi:uncharacterized protein LOC125942222 isoform X2 [Dermacentor silvarum]|uniref:uncharacterized protein LOC125942222 isoform X2 n=1 Tax=Dermacentor silvarum TaxID=543639 RepID=UPI0021018C11|nr:uncharacterized protein LOC125942222 isoform X2 [Dermacentor silvarum]XP_049516338.1 uncharacterized protein LOC125942222 isoform X2 [Dermacentor silvarum]